MSARYVDLGAIRIMLDADGKMLPESFCPNCGSIMAPKQEILDNAPEFQKYACTKCDYTVDRGQIDTCRKYSRYQ